MKLFWKKDSEEVKRARMKEQNDILKNMNSNIEKLTNLLENGAMGRIAINTNGETLCSYIDTVEDRIRNCTVSPSNMEEYVQKEILYTKDYDKRWKKYPDLIDFIDKYLKPSDKYEVIDLFDELSNRYEIKKRG